MQFARGLHALDQCALATLDVEEDAHDKPGAGASTRFDAERRRE